MSLINILLVENTRNHRYFVIKNRISPKILVKSVVRKGFSFKRKDNRLSGVTYPYWCEKRRALHGRRQKKAKMHNCIIDCISCLIIHPLLSRL